MYLRNAPGGCVIGTFSGIKSGSPESNQVVLVKEVSYEINQSWVKLGRPELIQVVLGKMRYSWVKSGGAESYKAVMSQIRWSVKCDSPRSNQVIIGQISQSSQISYRTPTICTITRYPEIAWPPGAPINGKIVAGAPGYPVALIVTTRSLFSQQQHRGIPYFFPPLLEARGRGEQPQTRFVIHLSKSLK